MDEKRYIDIIELLQQQIKQEEENYARGLKEGKQFSELKAIRNKKHQLQSTLERLQGINQEKQQPDIPSNFQKD